MPRASSGSKAPSAGTLVKNLRLLDLDEEFDWPDIQFDTFAASSSVQDQQQRCYAAQWVLYKLFALCDPEWTRAALQDLFPPLESKQSTELRLRTYKQLAALKQNGNFPNDLLIRRTMFDDCKGAKFEELLTAFSSLVLQRAIARAVGDGSRVRKMSAGSLRLEKEQRLPLILAYQFGCGKVLEQRRNDEQVWKNLEAVMGVKEAELHTASARLEDAIPKRQEKRIPKRTLDRLRSAIEMNWVGDKEWIDIVLQSDQHRPKATFLERQFSEIWSHACKDTLYKVQPRSNDSLLRGLQSIVKVQNERLARWRSVQGDLLSQMDQMSIDSLPMPGASESMTKHEDLPLHVTSRMDRTVGVPAILERESSGMADTIVRQRSSSHNDDLQYFPSYEAANASNRANQGITPMTPHGHVRSKSLIQSPGGSGAVHFATNALADQIIASVSNAAPTPAKAPLTLAERTRMSMARLSPQSRSMRRRDTQESMSLVGQVSNAASPVTRTPETSSYASLAERTRQSMSYTKVGQHSTVTRKPRASRMSNVYPVNQFDTPKKLAPGVFSSPDLSLLEERLDALVVDEESAFRSRPLVADSPSLRPQADTIEENVDLRSSTDTDGNVDS